MKTYSAMRPGIGTFATDALRLYRVRSVNAQANVQMSIDQRRSLQHAYWTRTGTTLAGRDVLVIGGGQMQREAVAFGVDNAVTAIDLDVIPQGWRPGPYIDVLRTNGATRLVKTVGRKLLGIDRRFRRDLCESLGVSTPGTTTTIQMDASSMGFPDASYDLVYSFSVFEHLDDPEVVLREAIRVLRPGGLLWISAHLYSSEGGCHDLRIFAGARASVPYWAQLRPDVKHLVIESCAMNEWRLGQWRALFDRCCPGWTEDLDRHADPHGTVVSAELARLRSAGELDGYSDEELLSVNVCCQWRKPAP